MDLYRFHWALFVAHFVIYTRTKNVGGNSCEYKFQVFQPSKDVLLRLEALESKCEAVTSQAVIKLNEQRFAYQNGLLTSQNATAEVMQHVASLKLEDALIRNDQKNMELDIHKFQTAWTNLLRDAQTLAKRVDTIRRHGADMKSENKNLKNQMALIDKTLAKHQNALGDLKGEWVLVKRDVEAVKADNINMKFGQNSLKDNIGKLEKMSRKHDKDNALLTNQQADLTSSPSQLRKKLNDFRSDSDSSSASVKRELEHISKRVDSHEKEILFLKENSRKLVEAVTTLKSVFDSQSSDKGEGQILLPDFSSVMGSFGNSGSAANSRVIMRPVRKPRDCHDHVLNGHSTSGVYQITPRNVSQAGNVYCEIILRKSGLTGWTLLQRRIDGSLDFNRGWLDYKYGFGNPYGEFWIGNEWLHHLSQQKDYILRIDMWDWEGRYYYAQYHEFRVGDDQDRYVIHINGYHGNAGDSFIVSDNVAFSSPDSDNDMDRKNCAEDFKSGWWFKSCGMSNLNGRYNKGVSSRTDGISWYTIKESDFYSLKKVEMKIRPRDHRRTLKPGS